MKGGENDMIVRTKGAVCEQGAIADLLRDGETWSLVIGSNAYPVLNAETLADLGRDSYKVVMREGDTGTVVRFSDLHRHSDCSLLDGMTKIPDMVRATEYSGALTDHGVLYGFLEYYKAMRAAGKKPIIGFEAYAEDMDGNLKRNHLILLAKNLIGYKNLLKLASESSEHFYGKPHVTWEMLERYHEGVIATSACLAGVIPQLLLAGEKEKAEAALKRYLDIFGCDFYIEIQRHHISDEDKVRPMLVELARRNGVPYIAATDSHYPTKEDAEAHEVLLCLQTKKTLDEPHMTFPGTGYHLHSSEEMERLFSDYPEALDATLDLADKCEDDIVPLGEVNLPAFQVPEDYPDETAYFEHLSRAGFHDRFHGTVKETSEKYKSRFEYELEMVKQMGFCGYFLIVWDFINFARSKDIYVGPGRGSAAGSLVAYCLGITDIDPLEYDLLFERFLNPERISMPDVDTDFEHVRRQEVYNYCCRKYGEDHVSHIITFGTMAAKMAIRDVARVLGYPAATGNAIAKMIPAEINMTIAKAMEQNPELKNAYETQSQVTRVVDIAKALEGGKRHASQHACGVLVAPGMVSNWVPTSMETDEDTGEKGVTAQVSMTECEELSLLKMDFLGLKNMTVIHEVCDGVVRDYGLEAVLDQIGASGDGFRYQDIPLTDRETYRMLASGMTGGVFQLESPGMTRVIIDMFSDVDTLPDEDLKQCFERLIAAVALYRPGPIDYIPDYLAGMRDPAAIHFDCPEEEGILTPTYGVLVYQEQLMEIAKKLAGYSLGEADILRKGCAKKKTAILLKEHVRFVQGNRSDYEAGAVSHYVPGCVGNGISEEIAEEIWQKMTKFASYAFNKSHAACYAFIAFITAYMSCHWPLHFYCAMLNAFIDTPDKVKAYLSQAVRRGLRILPPDINRSRKQFSVDRREGGIRFGLRGIANLDKIAEAMIEERDANGEYADMQDLYQRLFGIDKKLSKQQMERLIFSGATAAFGYNHREQEALAELVRADTEKNAEARALGQYSLFGGEGDAIVPPAMTEYSKEELLEREFESLGIYLSGHPVNTLLEKCGAALQHTPIADLLGSEEAPTKPVLVIGQIRGLKKKYTKKGTVMFNLELQDQFHALPCVVFQPVVDEAEPLLNEGSVVGVLGRFQRDETFGDQIIADEVYSEDVLLMTDKERLVVTVHDKKEQTELLSFVVANPGSVPVVLKRENSTREYATGRSVRMHAGVISRMMAHWRVEA